MDPRRPSGPPAYSIQGGRPSRPAATAVVGGRPVRLVLSQRVSIPVLTGPAETYVISSSSSDNDDASISGASNLSSGGSSPIGGGLGEGEEGTAETKKAVFQAVRQVMKKGAMKGLGYDQVKVKQGEPEVGSARDNGIIPMMKLQGNHGHLKIVPGGARIMETTEFVPAPFLTDFLPVLGSGFTATSPPVSPISVSGVSINEQPVVTPKKRKILQAKKHLNEIGYWESEEAKKPFLLHTLKRLDPYKRPCVVNGATLVIGPPSLTSIMTNEFRKTPLYPTKNLYTCESGNLVQLLAAQKMKKLPFDFKHFIYLVDCDKGYSKEWVEQFIRDFARLEKLVDDKRRVTVFLCKPDKYRNVKLDEHIQMDQTLRQVTGQFKFELRPFIYDYHKDGHIEKQVQYCCKRYIHLATDMYRVLDGEIPFI